MSDNYTLRLGPLSFRTTADNGPTEAIGNAVEVVGAALVAADPTPKPITLTIPVGWAGRDSDARTAGLRARRQVRALLNNAQVRTQGLYFAWDIDPDLNGWLIVGGGDLEPGDAGGVTHGEWKLTLRDCYVAGRRRTHRPAMQASILDLRAATSPRDTLRTFYGTAFDTIDSTPVICLPVDATDVTTYGRALALTPTASRDGFVNLAVGAQNGQVASYEQPEASRGLAGVAVFDRRESAVEAQWEQLFGPDQELTAGDIPVLDNARCRTRWVSGYLALDAWTGSAWEERGRVLLGTLVSATVREWTPERAVLSVVATDASRQRCVFFVTVQRGWAGPLIEGYAGSAVLRYVVAAAASVTFTEPTNGAPATATGNPLGAGSIAAFTGANWVEMTSGGVTDALGVVQSALRTTIGGDTAAYGSSRSFVALSAAGLVSARFWLRVSPGAGASISPLTLSDARSVPTLVSRT